MNKIAVRVSYGVYILALLFVVVMLFFDRYQFEPYAIGALVGLIPSTISHIMWAMYVEMSENIVHIASRNTSETDRTLSDISQTLGKILANMSDGDAVRPDTPWKCSCGKVNSHDANFCQNCGAPRANDIPDISIPGIREKNRTAKSSPGKYNICARREKGRNILCVVDILNRLSYQLLEKRGNSVGGLLYLRVGERIHRNPRREVAYAGDSAYLHSRVARRYRFDGGGHSHRVSAKALICAYLCGGLVLRTGGLNIHAPAERYSGGHGGILYNLPQAAAVYLGHIREAHAQLVDILPDERRGD